MGSGDRSQASPLPIKPSPQPEDYFMTGRKIYCKSALQCVLNIVVITTKLTLG